jgi:hypothetical protein
LITINNTDVTNKEVMETKESIQLHPGAENDVVCKKMKNERDSHYDKEESNGKKVAATNKAKIVKPRRMRQCGKAVMGESPLYKRRANRNELFYAENIISRNEGYGDGTTAHANPAPTPETRRSAKIRRVNVARVHWTYAGLYGVPDFAGKLYGNKKDEVCMRRWLNDNQLPQTVGDQLVACGARNIEDVVSLVKAWPAQLSGTAILDDIKLKRAVEALNNCDHNQGENTVDK